MIHFLTMALVHRKYLYMLTSMRFAEAGQPSKQAAPSTSISHEAMVGETTLSRGSDSDAVWLCPRRMKAPIVG